MSLLGPVIIKNLIDFVKTGKVPEQAQGALETFGLGLWPEDLKGLLLICVLVLSQSLSYLALQ